NTIHSHRHHIQYSPQSIALLAANIRQFIAIFYLHVNVMPLGAHRTGNITRVVRPAAFIKE
ncbi:MAG: hypothetical protein ACRCVV_16180, partial [Shewanella sp.]